MGIFGRRKRTTSVGLPTYGDDPRAVRVVVADTDWRVDANIAAEWQVDPHDIEQDMLGWRNGMRMAQGDEVPGQRFNEAEYMSRGLKHVLTGDCPLSDEEQIESIRRILDLLDRVPGHVVEIMEDFMPKVARLALWITRQRGWQSLDLGGDGRVHVDRNSPIVQAATACTAAPDGRYVDYFFTGSRA